jgi:hypothetical protein
MLIIVIAVGVSRDPKKEPDEEVEVSLTERELDELGKSLEGLEFDDLVGLSGNGVEDLMDENPDVELAEIDLDKLGELLEGLEFEDLGGLTEN